MKCITCNNLAEHTLSYTFLVDENIKHRFLYN